MHYAAWHGNLAIVCALLAAGAAIPKPERPLEGSDEVLEVIRQHES